MDGNMKLADGQFLKITELYAFVAKDKNGHEGIIAVKLGEIMVPLIGADFERVETFKKIADDIARQQGIDYEIRYFKST